jgi:hypothetical protein
MLGKIARGETQAPAHRRSDIGHWGWLPLVAPRWVVEVDLRLG